MDQESTGGPPAPPSPILSWSQKKKRLLKFWGEPPPPILPGPLHAAPACRRIDVEGVGPTNHAGLTSGVTQQDLDETWRKELLRLYGVMQSYKQVAPDPPPGVRLRE